MSRLQIRLVSILAVCLALALITLLVVLGLGGRQTTGSFVPPSHDAGALVGAPSQMEEAHQYMAVGVTDTIAVAFCTKPIVVDNIAYLYFTNPDANAVSCRVRITDEKGNLLGESGLISAGEYIEGVTLSRSPSEVTSVVLTVLTYREESYLSAGTITVRLNLTPQEQD